MTNTTQNIIEAIRFAGAEDTLSAIKTLEDGAALLALGIDDQNSVEDAHEFLTNAYNTAENWYNDTPKTEVLAWYESVRATQPYLESIDDGDALIEDWAIIVIEARVRHGQSS